MGLPYRMILMLCAQDGTSLHCVGISVTHKDQQRSQHSALTDTTFDNGGGGLRTVNHDSEIYSSFVPIPYAVTP